MPTADTASRSAARSPSVRPELDRVPLPSLQAGTTIPDGVDTVVVGMFRGTFRPPGTDDVLDSLGLGGDVELRTADFSAEVGQTRVLAGAAHPRQVIVTGLGWLSELTPEVVRRAAGAAARVAATTATHMATTLALVDPEPDFIRAVAEGLVLGAARDVRFKSAPDSTTLTSATVVVPTSSHDAASALLTRAARHGQAQVIARELVTSPSGHLGPEEIVDWLRAHLPESLAIEVDDHASLQARNCGALLSVAAGSSRPPRLVRIRRTVDKPVAHVALVGKGITFDSGGLSLKSPTGQTMMKKDMGGAATLVAVMHALAESTSPVDVTAWLALAENMPSGSATRPGDVVTAANGTTIEVANTDAEGRLAMADALVLAAREQPDALIDVATLTGAIHVAVGRRAFGAFGNDDALLDRVLRAADAAGESAWHLPLWQDLDEGLESDIADLANVAWGPTSDSGGATIAGLFLQHFVDDVPWVHLDISGVAWGLAERGHLPKGPTGTGVRTLLQVLETTD